MAGAAGVGLLFGLLAIRRSGIYFSMITLALAQMLYFFFLQAPFTGGEDGLQSVPRGSFLGLDLASDLTLFYVVLGIFIAAFWLIYRIVHSPFGQVLTSIRENEARATSLGYDTGHFKLLAFVLSAGLAGLAGSTKTLVLGFATLTDAIWTTSGLVILMTLVGGMGTLVGPMVGALVIIALENKIGDFGKLLAELTGVAWFNGLGESVSLVTGLIFIVCVLAFRRGLVGEAMALWEKRQEAAGGLLPEHQHIARHHQHQADQGRRRPHIALHPGRHVQRDDREQHRAVGRALRAQPPDQRQVGREADDRAGNGEVQQRADVARAGVEHPRHARASSA